MKNIYFSLLFVLMSAMALAQGTVTGTVADEDGYPSIGAVVRLDGTPLGAITDLDGGFVIDNVPAGDYNLSVSSVGYDKFITPIVVVDGQTVDVGAVSLTGGSLSIQGVEIIADIAIDRKTPVAVTNIDGDYISERTGNQDLTAVMATAPAVYASSQGGGFGDSRITVRGFDDRNVVVMVNGVPVNDMENQALYWSNWAGLADVASKIQIQRGLGASMLAVPSIGGTINIISKATDLEKGGWASASIGNDMYRKYGVNLSTGDMNGWAITASGTRTVGDGYVDGNFIDAYSWFGAITKDWGNHSLSLTGFGAPQRHGQGYRRTLSTFVAPDGSDYETYIEDQKAHDFDASGALRDNATGSANSIRYNSGWGYTGYDVNNGFNQDGVFNQYSNFYHKPQVSLSHYWDSNDRLDIVSNIYGSWGRGGGASNWGRLSAFGYQQGDANGYGGPIDWDQLIDDNIANNPSGLAGPDGDQYYFFRASMNHHNYYGLLSKAIYDVNDMVTLTGGIDARMYEADHVRKVIDMFGLGGYQHSDFAYAQPNMVARADDSVFGYDDNSLFNRDNTGFVNWIGGFGELEYETEELTAALGGSISNKSYKKEQRIEGEAGETDWYDYLGGAVKGGLNYNISDAVNFYGNAGYLSIQPIFDNVFQGGNNGGVTDEFIFEDAANEKVFAVELGSGLSTSNFAANLNLYRTNWQDKAITVSALDTNNEPIYGNAFGIDALHQGVELDLRFQPVSEFDITGGLSLGDWTWQNNSEYQLFDQQGQLVSDGGYYVEDVKVGNAPQTQFNIGGTYKAPFGLGLYANYQHNMDYYSLINVESRQNPDAAGVNSNQLPDFGLTNAGINYTFDITSGNKLRLDFNMNNVFDELYINEARESFEMVGTSPEYSPLYDLQGNFGLGRTWNAGLKLLFSEPTPPAPQVIEVPVPAEPVVLDRDGDGVIDAADKCPDTPGTVEGCPDSDGDGFVDAEDDCPETPGTVAGCPEEVETEVVTEIINVDTDGDGVVDAKDNCPDVAGVITNYGCPAAPVVVVTPTVEVVESMNFIAKEVLFNFDSDVLKSESKSKLDQIASIMKDYPDATFVIEGHTDSAGNAEYNKNLSKRRAASVVNYLVGKGINSNNLTSIGYGEERPIASNDTAEGRKQNRRVVIRLGN